MLQATVFMGPELVGSEKARAVMSWGQYPDDLDIHVLVSDATGLSCHMYYGNKNCYDSDGNEVVGLDYDNTDVSNFAI